MAFLLWDNWENVLKTTVFFFKTKYKIKCQRVNLHILLKFSHIVHIMNMQIVQN